MINSLYQEVLGSLINSNMLEKNQEEVPAPRGGRGEQSDRQPTTTVGEKEKRQGDAMIIQEGQKTKVTRAVIFVAVFSRCSDISPSVRSAALKVGVDGYYKLTL